MAWIMLQVRLSSQSLLSDTVVNGIQRVQEVIAMRIVRKIKIFSVVTAVLAVLMLAAPGYSWTGQRDRGDGGYYNPGYHNKNYGYRHYGHGYHNGYRHHGHYNGYRHYGYGSWNGYYRAPYYPRYYGPRYYAPSISLAFPLFVPGFSLYIGP